MSSEYLFAHKHILGLDHLSVPDIELILNTAESFKEISTRAIKKVPVLRGKTVVTLFFEPSTRTRLSFDIAAKRMSADILIMRHPSSGACHYLAKHIRTSVINAGDGTHEHPSQGLLDLMTVKEHKGEISGLKIAIIGDISHSRVAHSDIIGFSKMGAHVFVSGPATLIPKKIERLGATVCTTMAEAVSDADVVMPLRIQTERQNDPLIPSFREYATFFGINRQVLQTARPGALLMHPGPINRGVELAPDVADSAQSVILDQVTNGVAIRMALMYLVLGGK
jgi:aspartate carbamoyltransferase catalytic subunit